MNKETVELLAYYFPTTTVFVDDDMDFLLNFSLQFDPKLAFTLYDNPEQALNHINQSKSTTPAYLACFDTNQSGNRNAFAHHIIDLNLSRICQEVFYKERFHEISTVVVDYDMPECNGLELCQNINNRSIKKILLTGKADEKTAIEAFNQGIIDRFIAKNDPQIDKTLDRHLKDLKLEYFQSISGSINLALSNHSAGFLNDPHFSDLFHTICQQKNIVEFYLTANPDGFLMLNAQGEAKLLIVFQEDDFNAHYEIAKDNKAPKELLNLLKTKSLIPYFWPADGYYSSKCTQWQQYMHTAQSLSGSNNYHYTLIDAPEVYGLDRSMVFCYDDFLEQLDND